MDTDEIHGMENVAAAQVDDFTVETSLEDLEFGFSIVKSTQKVYDRAWKEAHTTRSIEQWLMA